MLLKVSGFAGSGGIRTVVLVVTKLNGRLSLRRARLRIFLVTAVVARGRRNEQSDSSEVPSYGRTFRIYIYGDNGQNLEQTHTTRTSHIVSAVYRRHTTLRRIAINWTASLCFVDYETAVVPFIICRFFSSCEPTGVWVKAETIICQ